MQNKIIVATNNKGKVKEISNKLKKYGIEVISQSEAGYNIEVEENGATFKDNAYLKAEAIYKLAKVPVIADDSGLEVDFLGGEPGVYSARYAGPNATNEQKMNKVLNLMKDATDPKDRTARFKCAICYINKEGKANFFEGVCEGTIIKEKRGEDGFGYDPIFEVNGKTFAECTMEEKNKISHRGRALDKLEEFIKQEQK